MSKRLIIFTFAIGAISLIVLNLLMLAHPAKWMMEHIVVTGHGNEVISLSDDRNILPLLLFLIIGTAIALLLGLGFTYRDQDRWLAFTCGGFLLTGLSLSWLYSLGGFLWPVGIILLIFSVARLNRYRNHGEPPRVENK